jgi:transcriptional regulator with XRE-family HTH domain
MPGDTWLELRKEERKAAHRAYTKAIAEHITQAREALGWTKSRLAREIGVSAAEISRYEKADTSPGDSTKWWLGEVLGAQFY